MSSLAQVHTGSRWWSQLLLGSEALGHPRAPHPADPPPRAGLALLAAYCPASSLPRWSQSGSPESGHLGSQRLSSPVLPLLCHPEANNQGGQRIAPIMYLVMSRMVSINRRPSFRPDQLT